MVHPVGAGMTLLRCKVHKEKVVPVVWVFLHDISLFAKLIWVKSEVTLGFRS